MASSRTHKPERFARGANPTVRMQGYPLLRERRDGPHGERRGGQQEGRSHRSEERAPAQPTTSKQHSHARRGAVLGTALLLAGGGGGGVTSLCRHTLVAPRDASLTRRRWVLSGLWTRERTRSADWFAGCPPRCGQAVV
jgi:hypothetical protein